MRTRKFMYIKLEIVKCSLQNKDFLHYIEEKFAHIKKKQYLCSVIKKTLLTIKNLKL